MTEFTTSLYRLATAHEEMNPKRRSTMEDVHRIVPNLLEQQGHVKNEQETEGNNVKNTQFSYFGVYDGHGGRQIADFLDDALEKNVAIELIQPDEASIPERLSRAFLITDMQSRQLEITTSGATAVCALLRRSLIDGVVSKTLFVANVGDSRAVLVSQHGSSGEECEGSPGFFATRLTYDHRAEDEGEQKRIKDAGGFIARGRVLGILAVSRSFGDHGMKDFVIANPHITETKLDEVGECPFLILACDGVWDVLTDQEAGALILNLYKERGGPFEDAAKILVQTAIDKGSADNVTALVIFL